MNSQDLTHEQLEPLAQRTREMTEWLQSRLEANSFPSDDELLRVTREAFDRAQHLRMTLHYLNSNAMRRPP